MTAIRAALWGELLKARRSPVPGWIAAAFAMLPLVGGLFMIILRQPERAQELGLLGQKARLAAGTADWPALLGMIVQGGAAAGEVLLSLLTGWVFGREFSDRTVRLLLASPTPRWAVVVAKALTVMAAAGGMGVGVFGLGLGVGSVLGLPGFSWALVATMARTWALALALGVALQPVAALAASAGRGYLAPVGVTLVGLACANVTLVLGRGAWFPWAVPLLAAGAAGTTGEQATLWSYGLVGLTGVLASAATLRWWARADQA